MDTTIISMSTNSIFLLDIEFIPILRIKIRSLFHHCYIQTPAFIYTLIAYYCYS